MSVSHPPPKKKRRRWLRTLLLCVLGTLALNVALALAYRQYFVWQADLIPEYLDRVPQDCFRKAPLIFRKLPDGLVIYSVGPDGEDDGGLIIRGERPPPKERGVPANEDIGFRLWDVDQRRQPPPPRPKPAEEPTP